MSINSSGVPSTDPHTMLTTLISTHMESPDGVWTPSVQAGWFDYKLQKTYQICITPLYAESEQAQLTGGTGSADPRISSAFFLIHLYAPDRITSWGLYRKMIKLLNDSGKTSPQNVSGLSGVASTGYHWVRVVRAEGVNMIEMFQPDAGPTKPSDKESAGGFRQDITVEVRWNE